MATSYSVRIRGDRPPYSCIAFFLWGRDAKFDSESDASFDTDPNWTELTLVSQKEPNPQIDIRRVSKAPLIVEITGVPTVLAARSAYYLATATRGDISLVPTGPFLQPEFLETELGEFDLETALWNAAYL